MNIRRDKWVHRNLWSMKLGGATNVSKIFKAKQIRGIYLSFDFRFSCSRDD